MRVFRQIRAFRQMRALDDEELNEDIIEIDERDGLEYVKIDVDNEVSEVILASIKDLNVEKKIQTAKEVELENWKNFNLYKEVKNEGQKAISARWVLTEKDVPGSEEKRVKARLVARGFEEKEDIKSDSPTVSKEVMRAFITICFAKGWKEHSIVAKSAFLQSEGIGREVYLIPSKEAKSDKTVLW